VLRTLFILAILLLGCDAEPLVEPPLEDCATTAFPAQQLRLLSRHEYDATVKALVPGLSMGSCAVDADCTLGEQSCVATSCVVDPCELVTFVLPAPDGPHGSVHVAGSFNDWPADTSNGWSMAWVPERQLYYAKRAVPDGEYAYKFVIDESDWLNDPGNPATTDDGFGGFNSVLIQQCDGAPPPADAVDFAADLPPESRPQHFWFDNHADAGLVTSIHVEQYLRAGEAISERALQDRDALLGCSTEDAPCATSWVRSFGSRAFRRPLTQTEVDRYVALVLGEASFTDGVALALQVMLSSPHFLYRSEVGVASAGHFRLDPHETATALSYFLWGTMPDADLFAAADAGELATADQVRAQVRRLLDDPRARLQLGRFAAMWLGVERILTADKSPALFPQDNDALRAAMLEETQRFVDAVVFEGSGRFDELLEADWTFVNADLASLYGLPAVDGWEQATLPEARSGLLGHASVLASTAHSDQTSPVRRGLFVRERLLCQSLGTPPAEAGGVPDVDPNATTIERFSQHADDPVCAGCHQYIDPIGFGFERFDALGAWRTTENGAPIPPEGSVVGVDRIGDDQVGDFTDLGGLATVLADSTAAPTCFAEETTRFALGREVLFGQQCAVQGLGAAFAEAGNVQELLIAIASSDVFLNRSEVQP
jgi:hypothetical protein